MDASTGHAVAYRIGPIFKHIIDCVQLYFTNGFTNIVLQSVNCLWLVDVTLIFDGIPQIIVQWYQIAAPTSALPLIMRSSKAGRKTSSVASAVWHVAMSCILLFNICEQKFVKHGPITIAIDCNGFSCSFSKKNYSIMPLEQNPHQTVTRFGCVGFSMYACRFSVPQMRKFCLFTYPLRSK